MDIDDTEIETTETPEVPETPDVHETPEPSAEEAALAALDEGIATETPESIETPVADPVPGTPEALAKAQADADAAAKKPPKDEAVEAEIKTLGLKENSKSSDRFRDMAAEIKALAPVKEALAKAGITDPAQLPVLMQRATDYAELIGMVQETKATPEQYGMALDYLKDVNAAMGGDRQAAERAYAAMQGEMTELAKILGKEVPGSYDPLSQHPDLQQKVAAGMPRDAAMEIVQLRHARALDDNRRQADDTTRQKEQAVQQGVQSLNQLGNTLQTNDPDYARKLPFLLPTLQIIKQTLPPSQWVQATQTAYLQIPAMPAPVAAPAAKPVPGPVRGGTLRPAVRPTTDDPMEAMELGIAAASGG